MRKHRNGIILTLVYLFTRLPFLVTHTVYYDSFEYVSRIRSVSWNTLLAVIRESHSPVHTLYIGLAGVMKIITQLPPEKVFTLLSVIFGLSVVYLWHTVLLRLLRDTRTALWGTLAFTLFPGFWRITTNILYEPLLLAFQAGTMAALLTFYDTKRARYAVAALLCYTGAQLTFIGNIFIAVPIIILAGLYKPKQLRLTVVILIASLVTACVVDRIVLGSWATLIQNYVTHAGDTVSPAGGILIITGRMLRNIIFITSALTYPLSTGIALVAIWTLRRNKHIIMLTLTFLCVSFLEMQYWHAGYYGRIGIFVLFPVSLILGKFFGKKPVLGLGLCTVLAINIVALGANQRKVPYVTALRLWALQSPAALFITGDYTRFAFAEKTNTFIVRDPQRDIPKLTEAVKTKQRIFLDKSILTYPYNQPDGWQYQLLSRQNRRGILADWFSNRCTMQIAYEYPSAPPLVVYEATSCE